MMGKNNKKLLVGIDIGSTVIKAILVNCEGSVVQGAEYPVPVQRPHPGWVERDASMTWEVVQQVFREAIGTNGNLVHAVSVAGCGNGAVFVDEDLIPLRAGILSSDTRAVDFVQPAETVRGQQPYAGQLGPLHDWFSTREPALAGRLRFSLCWKDYIRAKLTGVVCSDYTDTGAAGLLDYSSNRMRREESPFAPPRESCAPAGGVLARVAAATGLRPGTPVFTGCIDCEAAALGSGVWSPGVVSIVAGTWSIIQAYVTTKPAEGVSHFLINPASQLDRWLVLEGSPSAMANFDWALRALSRGELKPSEALAEAEQSEPSALHFVPHVAPGTGAFIGLELRHGRGDLVRAVCEGIVFAHRIHLEALGRTIGTTRSVSLSGSATRSAFWCQLFADGLGCEVRAFGGAQLGALGAAICAGIGLGIWDSVPDAQNAIVPDPVVYVPRRDLSAQYARFRKLSERLTTL